MEGGHIDTDDYFNSLLNGMAEQGLYTDTAAFIEIVKKTYAIDTRHWTTQELPNVIIMRDTTEKFIKMRKKNISYLTKISNDSLKVIKQEIRKEKGTDGIIFHYSRPMFDSTMCYAVFKYRFYGIGKGVSFFHFDGTKWIEIADCSTRF